MARFAHLELPLETLEAAGITPAQTGTEVNRRLVLELYREGRVSLGKAAELAGLPLAEFLDFMAAHEAYLNYDEEDLAADRAALDAHRP